MASTTNALSFRTSHAIVAAEDYRGTSTGAGFDPQDPAHKIAIGVHLAPKVVAQKSGDIEVEDTFSQDGDFVLSSLRYKISLFLHHVLTRHCEESDFAWRVSSPVTTARYGNDLAPPSILYASAIMPRRSSIEVIIGESFAYNVHIIATPLTCPTLVVTNHETGEPEYKPVLTVCAVVGNLYRAFNTRLPSAHWRTFSINQKLVLAKGLHTRRKDAYSHMFNDAMSVWNHNLNEEEQLCMAVKMHELLDAYAFPVEEGSMIRLGITGVLVGDYLGGKTMFKGLQLGQEDKFILHTVSALKVQLACGRSGWIVRIL